MTALCGRLDPDVAERVYFGGRTFNGQQRHHPEDVEFARHLCAACPIRCECLNDALAVPETYDRDGIRGGLLPQERRALRGPTGRPQTEESQRWTGRR